MTDTTVKYFSSTMSDAPVLSGTAGTLISVLDACLVNGFGSVTLDSLVVAANVATATKSTGHNFSMIGNTGPVIKIEGATPIGLNGDWRVIVTSSTVFTFATSGISDQTATGTITAKRAPAGFSKVFSGTNKAAYRTNNITGTRHYLRVEDGTTSATISMYETMTDIDTGTGLTPSSGSLNWMKSSAASSATREWMVAADTLGFYFLCGYTSSTGLYVGGFFGDLADHYTANDNYHSYIIGNTINGSTGLVVLNNTANRFLSRSYLQTGGSVTASSNSVALNNNYIGDGKAAYPALGLNGFYAWPVDVWETNTVPRGVLPGVWNPQHIYSQLPDATVVSAIAQLPGRDLLVRAASNYRIAFDVSGPWR